MAETRHGGDSPPRKVRRNDEVAKGCSEVEVHRINIDRFPDEVMLHIFSTVSFSDLIDNVQNVCTRWRRLAHDPSLWLDKEYIVRGRRTPKYGRSCCGVVWSKCIHCKCEGKDEQILQTASVTPQLRKLTLMRNVKFSVLKKMVTYWPKLTTLKFDGSLNSDHPEQLKHIVEKCPKIQKLTMEAGPWDGREMCKVLSALEDLRSLEVLVERYHMNSINLKELAATCPHLKELNFQSDRDDVIELVDCLKAKQDSITSANLLWALGSVEKRGVVPMQSMYDRWRTLELYYHGVPHWMAATPFKALGELRGLEELSIKVAEPQPSELISLAFRPRCLTQLRRLVLRRMDELQDKTLLDISRACPNLRELRLYGTYCITDEGLSEIHRLKQLKILMLSGCSGLCGALFSVAQLPALHTLVLESIDLVDMEPSLRDILDMKELRRLDILDCSGVHAVPYLEFPGRLEKLRELRVTYGQEYEFFFEYAFSELQRRMPHLRVYNTYWLEDGDWSRDEDCLGDSDCSSDSGDPEYEYSEEGDYSYGDSYAGYDGGWS